MKLPRRRHLGASSLENGLLIAAIAVAAFVGVTVVGQEVNRLFGAVGNNVSLETVESEGNRPAENSSPVASDVALGSIGYPSTGHRTYSTGMLLAGASDPDHDALSVTSVSNANNGTAVLNGNEVTFTAHGSGPASFDFVVADDKGLAASATATITVVSRNSTCRNWSEVGNLYPHGASWAIDLRVNSREHCTSVCESHNTRLCYYRTSGYCAAITSYSAVKPSGYNNIQIAFCE